MSSDIRVAGIAQLVRHIEIERFTDSEFDSRSGNASL